MILLGISAGFHDAAAALVVDGAVAAAVEEERLTRIKHDPSFPGQAADACLQIAGIGAHEIDAVVFHEKPLGVLSRHLTSRLAAGPLGVPALLTATPTAVREQLAVPARINRWFRSHGAPLRPVHYAEHHASHLASAFYPSPFEEAAILAIDGVGEWATCSLAEGRGRRITIDREIRYPHSIGLLYTAFTTYCGFRANSGEGELMGLAPFGVPRYADTIRSALVHQHDDGAFEVDQRYFAYRRGTSMTNRRFHHLFDGAPRPLGAPPTQREADLAASVQAVTEDLVLGLARAAHRSTGLNNLCLSGGVALNCVANGRLAREGPFEGLWIQPAAGDAGSAVGAALWMWHATLEEPRMPGTADGMGGAFLGPAFGSDEIEAFLTREGVPHRRVTDEADRNRFVAERLAQGDVVGWFVGRMEFGPRALGHRSILADPRSATVHQRINAMVKERAAFRPLAPAVLADRCDQWFDPIGTTPYMTATSRVRADHLRDAPPAENATLTQRVAAVRSDIPAVTHVDNSTRTQVVDPDHNPEFAQLIEAFDHLTGCPVVLNTSFNARDEPIVCTPADALRTFRRTGLDLLVLESCLVEQDARVTA